MQSYIDYTAGILPDDEKTIDEIGFEPATNFSIEVKKQDVCR